MRILFISHTYPPITGGVETQNYELFTWLSKLNGVKIKIIANKKRWLVPFFLFYAMIKAILFAKKYDIIFLGSCILGNVGWGVKIFSKTPVITVAHGLDLTWKNFLYQRLWVKKFIPKIDKIIAVGNETIRVGIARGIAESKFVFIPNGVDTEKNLVFATRKDLEKIVKENLKNKKVILTLGRLVRRKGVAWFVENVMPKLPENIIYIIAGEGPDKKNIESVIKKTNMESRIKMLGYVTDKQRNILFNASDLFIQPNIKVKGDVEGFGISVIEAGSCRLPVIASKIEGLQDAIKDGENGILIEACNVEKYVFEINKLLSDDFQRKKFGEKTRRFIVENYSWEKISQKYLEEIIKTVSKNNLN